MARFDIYSKDGQSVRYSGKMKFLGTYMKPGMLEFREVSSPTPIDFMAGDYVVYPRTGYTYRIYNVPQVKKQSRSNEYGGAFVYQNVQLFDASKMLEYCPFRDLVAGDNRIHFSTQPSISTYEGCDGLARRFEACLRDQYDVNGVQSWAVRIATDSENPDLHALMLEPREFTVSGVNILQCLDKIYEIWPEVGWIYKVENGIDTIVIGGGGSNANEGTYAYGKGMGLTSLTRTVANADEMANRIYAYGSSRNMLPRWYNGQDIKDAESVDIQNLMIPVEDWGTTEVEGTPLPDAAKAYIEDTDSIAKVGLRPKTVYFDGSGEYPAIYPSIRETTIKMVRDALGSSSERYYPSTSVYLNENARVDRLLAAQASFDSGLAGDTPGRANVESDSQSFSASNSFTMFAGQTYYPFYHYQGVWHPDSTGYRAVSFFLDLNGSLQLEGVESCIVSMTVKDPSYQGPVIASCNYELTPDAEGVIRFSGKDVVGDKVNVLDVDYIVKVDISVNMAPQESDKTGIYNVIGNVGFSVQNSRAKTFKVSLRQIGFNITDQALLGDGKSIAMRTGKCAGRTFAIKSCVYVESTDSWELECWRSEDESLSQWFPNTDYPVRGLENAGENNEYSGDEFVLLDIAMPDIYILMAEIKLLAAAEELLADTAVERWQYVPEIDAKFMIENSRVIRAGDFLALIDSDLIGDGGGGEVQYFRTSSNDYLLTSNGDRILLSGSGGVTRSIVDSITISEEDAAIPTYKVTLRDRKRKTWTESESPTESSSKSVGNSMTESGGGIDLSNYVTNSEFLDLSDRVTALEEESFFTLDNDGNVTLKSDYDNLWVPGWLAAGGVGTGGGGGGVTSLYDLTEVDSTTNPSENDVFFFDGTDWTNSSLKTINGNSLLGSGDITISGGGSTVSIDNLLTTGTRVATITIDGTNYNILAPTSGGGGGGEVDPVFSASAAYNITNQDITNWNNKTSNIGTITGITMNGVSKGTSGVVDLGTVITSVADYALKVGASTYNFEVATLILPNGTLGRYAGTGTLDERIQFSFTDPSTVTPTIATRILAYTTDIPTSLKNPKSLTFGNKTYDGSVAREILASDLGAVTLAGTQTITGLKTFSAATTFSGNISVGGTVSVGGSNVIDLSNSGSSLFNYGARAGRTANLYGTTINLRACDSSGNQTNILSVQSSNIVAGSSIIPNYVTGLNLGGNSSNQRWSTIYGVNGDFSGDLTLAATSHIDIGPVRIEYDSVNKAIHIKRADANDTNEYGFYCDGFVAAGGVQASE